MNWSKAIPTTPGLYWVWLPPDADYPSRGKVRCVEVEPSARGELEAWVPFMDYSDPLTDETWTDAMWLGPIARPDPPKP